MYESLQMLNQGIQDSSAASSKFFLIAWKSVMLILLEFHISVIQKFFFVHLFI